MVTIGVVENLVLDILVKDITNQDKVKELKGILDRINEKGRKVDHRALNLLHEKIQSLEDSVETEKESSSLLP